MKELTDDEKAYLRIAYNKGFRWVVTDKDCGTWFWQLKPIKRKMTWSIDGNMAKSLLDFGTSWEDKEPTSIAELLGIDDTDWTQVNPFTPVWVRDKGESRWHRKLFLEYSPTIKGTPFVVTSYNAWTSYGACSKYGQCKLATQEEIYEVIASRNK